MQKPMRAMASAWAVRAMRSRAAIRLVNGVLAKPKWATQGARGVGPGVGWSVRVGVDVVAGVIAVPLLFRLSSATPIYALGPHDAVPISRRTARAGRPPDRR